MHDPLAALLSAGRCAVLDGALATEMQARGADLDDPLWSAKYLLEDPALIQAVHRDYCEAGADIITTATYQASFEAFHARGIDAPAAAQLMRDAVNLAVTARDDYWRKAGPTRAKPLVAASIGPYGAYLADGSEYRGNYHVDDHRLREFHRERLQVLVDSPADMVAFETLPSLREAVILAQLLDEMRYGTAWISFSCADGTSNCEGESIAACAAALNEFSRIVAVGVNCTAPRFVAPLLAQIRQFTDKRLVAYPNAGEHYDAGTQCWDGASHGKSLAEHAPDWYAAGARLIGGCCRTGPRDIRALRNQLQAVRSCRPPV